MFARPDVPGAYPPRHRLFGDPLVGNHEAVDHLVTNHDRRGVDAVQHRVEMVALTPICQGDADRRVNHAAAVQSKVGARPPGLRINIDDVAVAGVPEDPLVILTIGPVRHAALAPRAAPRRRPFLVALRVEHPDGLAGDGVNGDPLRQRGVEVEDAADHERRRLECGGVGRSIDPVEVRGVLDERLDDGVERRPPLATVGHRPADEVVDRHPLPGVLEVAEVAGVDLLERGVLGAGDVASVAPPLAVRGVVGLPGPVLLGVDRGRRAGEGDDDGRHQERVAHRVTSERDGTPPWSASV